MPDPKPRAAATSLSPDVIVVGGGAVGVCVALELARRSIQTTLVEREHSLGLACSAGNMGLICPGHSAPIATPKALRVGLRSLLDAEGPLHLRPRPALLGWLSRYVWACRPRNAERSTNTMRDVSDLSLRLHAELAAEGLHDTFVQRGLLSVAESEAGLSVVTDEAKANEAAGLDTQVLDGKELRKLEPALASHVVGGAYYPTEAHCDSLRFVESVGRAAADAGATIQTGVEVLQLVRKGDAVTGVETTEGPQRADAVVLAGGSWSGQLGATAGVHVPVQGGKGYHLEVAPGDGDPVIPAILFEARTAATPLDGRIRLGGTLELAGLDLSVSRRRVEAIRVAACRGYPALAGRPVRHVWRGLRPCSPDGVPIVGPANEVTGLLLATGHTQMGLALAPITGRLIAERVAGEPPSYDLRALSPSRFHTPLG